MNIRELDIDDRMEAARLLEAMRVARQAAFEVTRQLPDLYPHFEAADAAYMRLVEEFGVSPVPIFDKEAHIAKRIENGDADYTFAYKR